MSHEDTIASGKQVSIEYTLTLDDGTVVDTNVDQSPLVYEQGSGTILPALENALLGMQVDDTCQVTLSPGEGYGELNPEALITVEAGRVPEDARRPGVMLEAQDPSGQRQRIRVAEVRDDEVVLDFNHPLAGKTLNFDVKVLAIA